MVPLVLENFMAETPRQELIDLAVSACPNILPLCVPKRLRIPPGYSNPNQIILSAFTAVHSAYMGKVASDATVGAVFASTNLLIRYQMPTYFVSAELCDALLHTDAPENLKLAEVPRPMPAMLLMLPLEFSRRYFGLEIPFLTVSYLPADYRCESPLRLVDLGPAPVYRFTTHGAEGFSVTCLSWEDNCPMHYDSRTPLLDNIDLKTLMDAKVEHFAYFSNITKDELTADRKTVNRLTNLAVNIILGMTAEPELITREHMIEPARKQNGKVIRPALWQPNMIGAGFRVTYEKRDLPQGSHASPHAHWRVGHWRNQVVGPIDMVPRQTKRMWIRPVFVGLIRHEAA